MEKYIDAKKFNLTQKTKIVQIDKNKYAIEIIRKSRIIMKDGKGILDKANMIKKVVPEAKIFLRTTSPLCSKTISYLNDNNIEIIKV